MSKIEEDAFMKRSRATWLAEKLDINFTRASNIMKGVSKATPKQKRIMKKAIYEEMHSTLHKKIIK